MRVLCVTHGVPDYAASGCLSNKGGEAVDLTGQRCRELIGGEGVIAVAYSSPANRRLETGLRALSAMARSTRPDLSHQKSQDVPSDVPATRIRTADELDEVDEGLSEQRLRAVLARAAASVAQMQRALDEHRKVEGPAEAVALLAVHGDLPSAQGLRCALWFDQAIGRC